MNQPTNPAITLPRNVKMKDLLKDFHQEIGTVSPFLQYTQETRGSYILDEKTKIIENFKPKMQKIIDKSATDIKFYEVGVQQIKDGNLGAENYASPTMQGVASSDFNSAVALANQRPEHLDKILITAANQHRNTFCYSLLSLLDESQMSANYKYKINNATEYINEKFGVTELVNKRKESIAHQKEAEELISLMGSDLERFESLCKTEVNIDAFIADGEKAQSVPAVEFIET